MQTNRNTAIDGRHAQNGVGKVEKRRPPSAAGTQNKRQLLSQLPFVLVDDTGLEPVTSRTSTPLYDSYNIFYLFMVVFATNSFIFATFEKWEFRLFRPCLWLVVWSNRKAIINNYGP